MVAKYACKVPFESVSPVPESEVRYSPFSASAEVPRFGSVEVAEVEMAVKVSAVMLPESVPPESGR